MSEPRYTAKSMSLKCWFVSPLLNPSIRYVFVSLARNSTYPPPDTKTFVDTAPESQSESIPDFDRLFPDTMTPTAFVHTTFTTGGGAVTLAPTVAVVTAGAPVRQDPSQAAIGPAFERAPLHRDRRARLAGTLAHGEQRALEIGMALASRPRLLLLDEPTAGMSRSESDHAVELISRVTEGKSLVMVEHDMGVVFGLADRISVVVYGEVIATDTPANIRNNRAVQEAYLGTSAATADA